MNFYSELERITKIQPKRSAIFWEGGSLSYMDFCNIANSIGSALSKIFNLKKGEHVALVMENDHLFLPILFGIWKAGLTAVPINSKLHKKELAWIFENSDTKLIFCSKDKISDIHSNMPVIVNYSKEFIKTSTFEHLPHLKTDVTDPAWIFYTSGTTGKPKGAVLTHRNLLFMSLAYFADVDSIDEKDIRLHAAPMTHGSGIYALPFILKGAKNYICQSNFEPEEIFGLLSTEENISFFAAPTMVKRLSSHPMASTNLKGLKTLEFGGAPMYLSDTKIALEIFGNTLYQLYGQGEAPMTITNITKAMYSDKRKPYYKELLISAGISRTACSVEVVDSNWNPVSLGEVGEIITKSDCVMKEYYKNEEATKKALRNGWLLTGDLGSIDQHGILTIKDRSKDMVITGGMNVYPREIEDVLLLHPDVKEGAVIGLEDDKWGEIIVAVLVLQKRRKNIVQILDNLCLQNLARFKRPKKYYFKEELPKNNYGKILKTHIRKEFSTLPS